MRKRRGARLRRWTSFRLKTSGMAMSGSSSAMSPRTPGATAAVAVDAEEERRASL